MKAKHALGLAALTLLASCQQVYQDKLAVDSSLKSSFTAPDMGTPSQLPAAVGADQYISKTDQTSAGLLWQAGLELTGNSAPPTASNVQALGPRLVFRSKTGSTFSLPRSVLKVVSRATNTTTTTTTPPTTSDPTTLTPNSPNGDWILQDGAYTPVSASGDLLLQSLTAGDYTRSILLYDEISLDFAQNNAGATRLFKNYYHFVDDESQTQNFNGLVSFSGTSSSGITVVGKSASKSRVEYYEDTSRTDGVEQYSVVHGIYEASFGYALTIVANLNGVNLGGKFILSAAGSQPYAVNSLTPQSSITFNIQYTLRGYDAQNTLVYTEQGTVSPLDDSPQ